MLAQDVFDKLMDSIVKAGPLLDLNKPITMKVNLNMTYIEIGNARPGDLIPIEIRIDADNLGWLYQEHGYVMAKSDVLVLISILSIQKFMEMNISALGKKFLKPEDADLEFHLRKVGPSILTYISYENFLKLNECS